MSKGARASWVIVLVGLLAAADAHAEAPSPHGNEPLVTVDLGAATAFPIMVGGAEAVLEGPFGLQLRGDLGWLGSPYVEAIDGFLLAVGAYGSGAIADATSDLVRAGVREY